MNPDGSQDSNGESFYETSNGQSVMRALMDGTGLTAAAKFTSKLRDFTIFIEQAIGGSENIADVNNETANVGIRIEKGDVRGKYAVSAKTSTNTRFSGYLTGKPGKWHVNLGSWSDQSSKPQEGTELALTAEQYPITIWSGNARHTHLDDPAKYKFVFKVWFCDVPILGTIMLKLFMLGWSILKKLHLA